MKTPATSTLGIIMLDTTFPRPPGDVGHRQTWPFSVNFKTVRGATPGGVVRGTADELLDAFVAAGEALTKEGAVGLITSCGFLALRQRQLAARLSVPVATSSLLQIPMIQLCLPSRGRVGVITYDEQSLTRRHFEEVGADPETPTAGLPADGYFRSMIEGGEPYRRAAMQREVISCVGKLLETNRDIAAVVFECTNLPPFAAAVREHFRLPVYDIVTMGTWFYHGLTDRNFGPDVKKLGDAA